MNRKGFINCVMPLIRDKTSDIRSSTEKRRSEYCGRNYDIVEKIEGREGDFLINLDGGIASINFNLGFDSIKNIMQFQLYQEIEGEVEIRTVKDDKYSKEDASIFYKN